MSTPITWFDACCFLGRNVHYREGQPITPEALLAEMDHFGIHEALVLDALAAEANPAAGNRRIVELTRNHPRLHPAWAGLMPQTKELPPPRDLVAEMREQGVGALFLFYHKFEIRLEDWGIDPLLEPLAEAGVPVFLCPNAQIDGGMDNPTEWDLVVRLCRRFPTLPVVVTESRTYRAQRAGYAALAACPNLHLDLSAWWLHRAVERLCREFGPQRLLWGSQLPFRCAAVPMMQIGYSDISQEALSLIAGGNLRRLLSWNEKVRFVADQVTFPPADDPLHHAARERLPLREFPVYDCHGHIGQSSPNHVIEDTVEDLLREMDKFGVRVCCVFSLEGVFSDETWGNNLVVEAVRRHPDRFVGFTLVNPHRGERLMREELERGLAQGMRGIKLIPHYHGYPAEGPNIEVACAFAQEHGLLVLNHNWGSAEHLERLCTTYPGVCFITGHSTLEYVDIAKRCPNLYICTCPFLGWRQTEEFVAQYGTNRLLFGSDLSDLPIAWGLAPIYYARLSEADKRKILGENLRRLLEKYGRIGGD